MPRATWRIMPARTQQLVAHDLGVGRLVAQRRDQHLGLAHRAPISRPAADCTIVRVRARREYSRAPEHAEWISDSAPSKRCCASRRGSSSTPSVPSSLVRAMIDRRDGARAGALASSRRPRTARRSSCPSSTAVRAEASWTSSSCWRRWGRRCCRGRSSRASILGGLALAFGGTAEQRAAWLPALAAGERRLALALGEEGGGPGADGIRLPRVETRRRLPPRGTKTVRDGRARRRPDRGRGTHGRRGRAWRHAVRRRPRGTPGVEVTALRTVDMTRRLCHVRARPHGAGERRRRHRRRRMARDPASAAPRRNGARGRGRRHRATRARPLGRVRQRADSSSAVRSAAFRP